MISQRPERPPHDSKRRCTTESPYGIWPETWRRFFKNNPNHRTSRSRRQVSPYCLRHHFANGLPSYCTLADCRGCRFTSEHTKLLDHLEYIEGWTEHGTWTPVVVTHPYITPEHAVAELKKFLDDGLEPGDRPRVSAFVGRMHDDWYATSAVTLIQPATCTPINGWTPVE